MPQFSHFVFNLQFCPATLTSTCELCTFRTQPVLCLFCLHAASYLWGRAPDQNEWASGWIKTSRIEFYFFFLALRVHLQSGWAPCQNGAADRAKTISLSPGAAQRFHMLCIHGGWQCIIWEKLMRKKKSPKPRKSQFFMLTNRQQQRHLSFSAVTCRKCKETSTPSSGWMLCKSE